MSKLIDADALERDGWKMHRTVQVDKDNMFYQVKKPTDFSVVESEQKKGEWVGVKEYCDHLNEEAEREGKGNRYTPSGMNIRVYCNKCWKPNDRRTTYCPHCGVRLVQEGEDNG